MSSESLFNRASSLFPGGVNSPVRAYSPYPRYIRSGSGSRIVDEDGKEYVDYCLAFGPMILGHANHEVDERLKAQVDLGLTFGAPGRLEVELGERIRKAIPSIEMMRFTNSGTEATLHAIRLARHYTGRGMILKLEGGFHGAHDYSLYPVKQEEASENIGNITIETPFNDIEALRRTFGRFGNRIAALILEPVMGNIGVVPPDPEFLREARRMTQEYGSLLIFDEVITAFRFHYGGYQDLAGTKPDLTTMGKIIGGGLPVGLFGGRRDIMENISPSGKLYQQGTFSANPMTMAGGLATLDVLSRSDYSVPAAHARKIAESAEKIFQEAGIPVKANQAGTMFTIFFNGDRVKDNVTASRSDTGMYLRFFTELLQHGVFTPKSQFEACFVSFAHTEDDLEFMVGAIEDVARRI